MVIYLAALGLSHALVEWVAMLMVAREGGRRRELLPSQRALVVLVCLREHTILARTAIGFGISKATGHACVHSGTELLASQPRP